jgi:mRNA-degrading endonuclease RelE of RelBE toxin-antitoxin system
MMVRDILLSSRAQRDFRRLPANVKERIRKALKAFASGSREVDIKELKGIGDERNLWRLRVGDYRVTFYPESDLIKVIRIDHRSRGYSWLD